MIAGIVASYKGLRAGGGPKGSATRSTSPSSSPSCCCSR
ncbi:hypothetical protein [Klenkia terrae]